MKKVLVSIVCLLALTFTAIPAAAQTRSRRNDVDRRYQERVSRNADRVYYDNSNYDYYYNEPSVWDRSRDKITTAGGAVAGAVIGGLIGGKTGALIGAIAGGGSAALYTYKIRDKY